MLTADSLHIHETVTKVLNIGPFSLNNEIKRPPVYIVGNGETLYMFALWICYAFRHGLSRILTYADHLPSSRFESTFHRLALLGLFHDVDSKVINLVSVLIYFLLI